MRNIEIPDFFMEKLNNTEELLLVQQYLSTFDDWYQLNENVFFREYTDHGPRHIREVWSTAEQLLTANSKINFSAADCAVLVCSTLLHDFAMHLQVESFIQLVSNEFPAVGENDFGDKPWASLWKEYISEIHRISDSSRFNLFGTYDPIEPPDLMDAENWTAKQNRYIGEFVRRHHPRIAYEITINGIPGTQGILPIDQIDQESAIYSLSMLSGIVARSHGMNLRETFIVIERDYHLISFQESHPIYLMILLRIADYVQLQSTRAPQKLLKIKKLKSPLSQSEWGLHDTIQGVTFDTEPDPEVLKVSVTPRKSNIDSYLKTQRLLDSIQQELDNSWAVLGEVYGRYPNEDWGITIRRIRSNIEDRTNFGRAAGFIPEEVKFTSANTELTKLLIKPLYGDYPEIAVRELVQNSIDACRERAFFEGAKSNEELDKYSVKAEVVNNTDGTTTLKVSDTGMGMTLDVLKRYFLNAGSSFRTSLAWKKEFADNKAKSEVLRSGRFGVGALAAFLVADDPTEIRLSVKTRHVKAKPNEAVSFETSLSDAPISVNFVEKNDIGTEISVTTSAPPSFMRSKESEEKEGNSWDWYCLEWPRVDRSLSSGKSLPQKYRLPTKQTERKIDETHYNFMYPNGFESVCWYFGDGHLVVCNGIKVIERNDYKTKIPELFEEKTITGPNVIKFPKISVMDKDGLLPLTLDRLRLDFDQIPFMRELREDVLLSLVSGLAVVAPKAFSVESLEFAEKQLKAVMNKFDGMDDSSISWVIANGRISILSGHSINKIIGMRVIEISSPRDIEFISNPSEYALILTKTSIFSSIKSNTSSGKYLHFLSDKNARDRLERSIDIIRRENANEYHSSSRSVHDRFISGENRIELEFIRQVKNGIENAAQDLNSSIEIIGGFEKKNNWKSVIQELKHLEREIKLLENENFSYDTEIHYLLDRLFHSIYDLFRGSRLLGELLDGFYRKLRNSNLDSRDGRRFADAISAISDATPRLKEYQNNDFNDDNCPVDWNRVKETLNNRHEDWFLSSWVLEEELDIERGFMGKGWHDLFQTDYIPFSEEDRKNFFVEQLRLKANNHLESWQQILEFV